MVLSGNFICETVTDPWHNSAALGERSAAGRLLAGQGSYRTAGGVGRVDSGACGTGTSIGQPRKDAKAGLVDCRFVITVFNRERQKFKASLGYMSPPEVGGWGENGSEKHLWILRSQ